MSDSTLFKSLRDIHSIYFHPELHELERKLLNHIDKNPGIRYMELLRRTGSTNGVLSYHLSELENSKQIAVDRKRGTTRYYPAIIPKEVSIAIGNIRNPIRRQIISLLLKYDTCTFTQLASNSVKVPSTVFWHIKKLLDDGIVTKASVGFSSNSSLINSHRYYCLANKALIGDILSKYIRSPLDEIVDDYRNIVGELN